MKDEWRLNGQEAYLLGKTFRKVTVDSFPDYDEETHSWDKLRSPHDGHEHCSFCWDKFSVEEADLHSGYFAAEKWHRFFVCEKCFEDFKEPFQWKVIEQETQGDGSLV